MALKTLNLYKGDPFVASSNLIDASVGRAVQAVKIGVDVQQTAAAIVPDNVVADTLNPVEVRLDGSPIISIRGSDLIALNLMAFGETPYVFRSAAVISNRSRVYGMNLHLNQPAREKGKLQYKFNYAAGANCKLQRLFATELGTDEAPAGGYYHMVEIPHTLPAATGYGMKWSFAMPGDLIGILLWNTTIMAAAADTQSILEIKLFVDGTEQIYRTAGELYEDGEIGRDNPTDAAVTTAKWLDNYQFLNLMEKPLPKASKVEWSLNAGVASDVVRLIPVYQVSA